MGLMGSTRSLPLGNSLIQPRNRPLGSKFSTLQRTPLAMDDMSRFQYAMLASLVLHALVVFGITIRPPDLSKLDSIAPPLEVVLVNAKSTARPHDAEVAAQRHLDGGGNTDLDRRAKSPLPVTRNDKETSAVTPESRREQQVERHPPPLITQPKSSTAADSTSSQAQPEA